MVGLEADTGVWGLGKTIVGDVFGHHRWNECQEEVEGNVWVASVARTDG